MFSRKSCYFFVRPKKNFLEVCVFLPRALRAPQVRRADAASKTRFANIIQVRHRDEVEAPITDWMQEAYEFNAAPPAPRAVKKQATSGKVTASKKKTKAETKKQQTTAKKKTTTKSRPRR